MEQSGDKGQGGKILTEAKIFLVPFPLETNQENIYYSYAW